MKKENGVLIKVDDEDIKLLETNPEEFWEGVTSIGNDAFRGCSSLTSIAIPSSVSSIGNDAFKYCTNLTSITIPSSVTSIGDYTFDYCSSLTSITIPSSVTSIGDGAFRDCRSLTSITIPSSVTSIGEEAFSACSSVTSITIPSSVTSIGVETFAYCSSLTSITIPSSVTRIKRGAFSECSSLTSIIIPEGVTSIGDYTFICCSSLTSITIPASINQIGEGIIAGCNRLKEVKIEVAPGKTVAVPKALTIKLGNDIITLMKEVKSLKGFNTLCKNIKIDEQNPSYVEFFRMCSVLGLMENKDVTIKKNGKDIPVADISFEILQKMFKQGAINYDMLHANLSNLKDAKCNIPLLEFLSRDKTTAPDFFSKTDKFVAVNNWFKARAQLEFTEQVQLEGNDPTIEENRFKVWQYVECEDGVYRVRWYSPTVELILEDMVAHKYNGITAKTKPIAEVLAKYNYEQKEFEKAVEIDEEREKLVAEGKLKNSLTETKVSQSIVEAVERYKQSTDQMESEISDNLAECASTIADDRSKIFTYEMLDKSSEENFVMGNLTSCCARLFGAGAGAQRAMILHPDMQPLVIRDVSGEIIAFSIVYVNREKGYAVLNDIEMNVKYDSKPAAVKRIYEKFEEGVRKFVDTYNAENEMPITQVNCGVSPRVGNAINGYIESNQKAETNLEAVNFDEYKYNGSGSWSGDWFGNQYIIWADDKENLYQR